MFFASRRKGPHADDPNKPEFRRRLVWTLLLVLAFRLLANIPIANVDEAKMQELLATNPLLAAIDLFAGGEVLKNFSIVAVGLFPYLIAAGFVRLGVWLIPSLRELEKESEKERLKRVTRAITLPLSVLIAWGIWRYLSLETGRFPARLTWFTGSEFGSSLTIVAAATVGSWLTEKIKEAITKHGLGSGESALLLVGSSLSLVTWASDAAFGGTGRDEFVRVLVLQASVALLTIVVCLPLLTAVRRIPMSSARTVALAARLPPGRVPPVYLPLLLNRGGNGPITSALGFLLLFQIAALAVDWVFPGRFTRWQDWLIAPSRPENGLYWALFAGLVVAFTYVYNYAVLWKPFKDSDRTLAEALKRDGFFVVGIRPGAETERYLSRVLAQVTLPAAITLAALAVGLPFVVLKTTGVNVAAAVLAELVFVKSFLDVRQSVEDYRALDRPYESLLRRGRIRQRAELPK